MKAIFKMAFMLETRLFDIYLQSISKRGGLFSKVSASEQLNVDVMLHPLPKG